MDNQENQGRTESRERWAQIKSLFSEALELPPGERAAFLKARAAEDADLLSQVQSLLDWHEEPGELPDSVGQQLSSMGFTESDTTRLGERIGAYRIVGVLGTG